MYIKTDCSIPAYEEVVCECEKHGKYQAIKVKTPDGGESYSECPQCEHEQLQKERHERYIESERRLARHAAKRIFQESSVPNLFSQVDFCSYVPSCPEAEEVKSRLMNFANSFDLIKKTGACALLIGNTGTGKTMLATAVANQIMQQGYTAFYTKCPRALNRIKKTWKPSVAETQEDEINKFRKPDLLIFDELPKGCTKANDWELVHDILDRRTEDRMPTISISTLKEEDLKKKIGEEVFRRLHYKGAILEFTWKTHKENHLF